MDTARPSASITIDAVEHDLPDKPQRPATYATVEEFSGPLVGLAGPDRVADGFRRHAEGLKRRSESLRP
jgi:hypothetical protein